VLETGDRPLWRMCGPKRRGARRKLRNAELSDLYCSADDISEESRRMSRKGMGNGRQRKGEHRKRLLSDNLKGF
jgi:hypothetical protein